MNRAARILLPGLLVALALQAGCRSDVHPWVPPQGFKVTVASDPVFVRTVRGDYLDGYLADYESEFKKQRMFLAVEIPHYARGDRLIVQGRFIDDDVRSSFGGRAADNVRVFVVEEAEPNVPAAPDVPTIK